MSDDDGGASFTSDDSVTEYQTRAGAAASAAALSGR
jgi:hypothetical protein